MKNLKLTTKPEILSYLEDKKVSLQKCKVLNQGIFIGSSVTFSASSFAMGRVLNLTAWAYENGLDSVAHTLNKGPVSIPLILGTAAFALSACSLCLFTNSFNKIHQCKYKLQETEQKIGWIKEGTFMRNTMLELENEVVEAREEKTAKVKTR